MNLHYRTTHSAYRIRPAEARDAADIARLFLVSSDGLAAYIWERDRAPEVEPMAHGAARYARQGTIFSYENCTVATSGDQVVAMLHAFEMLMSDGIEEDEDLDVSATRQLHSPNTGIRERPGPGAVVNSNDVSVAKLRVHRLFYHRRDCLRASVVTSPQSGNCATVLGLALVLDELFLCLDPIHIDHYGNDGLHQSRSPRIIHFGARPRFLGQSKGPKAT